MPDFSPLFVDGKLVFDDTGKPVFSRVRSGYVSFSVGVDVAYGGNTQWSIGGGSASLSVAYTITRNSYASYASVSSQSQYSTTSYLGTDSFDRVWSLAARISNLTFAFTSGSAYLHSFAVDLTCAIFLNGSQSLDSYTLRPTYYQGSNKYFPEGNYAASTVSGSTGNTYNGIRTVTVNPSTVTVTFVET